MKNEGEILKTTPGPGPPAAQTKAFAPGRAYHCVYWGYAVLNWFIHTLGRTEIGRICEKPPVWAGYTVCNRRRRKMKKNMVFSGLTGILTYCLVLGLFFSGCDTGSGTGGSQESVKYESTDPSGNTYNLTITESSAKYAAQTGDAYLLTITFAIGGTKTSRGTVASAGATIQLQPNSGSSGLRVTISGTSMTGITVPAGFKYDSGGTQGEAISTTSLAPSTGSTGSYTGPKSIKIAGFNVVIPETTDHKTGVKGRYLFIYVTEINNPTEGAYHNGGAKGQVINPSGNITFELSQNDQPWTGTGSYFILLDGPPKKDFTKDGGSYFYSVDGINPTKIDIKSAVTTLNWSNFVWFRDFTAG
jgi:hypothetical protein